MQLLLHVELQLCGPHVSRQLCGPHVGSVQPPSARRNREITASGLIPSRLAFDNRSMPGISLSAFSGSNTNRWKKAGSFLARSTSCLNCSMSMLPPRINPIFRSLEEIVAKRRRRIEQCQADRGQKFDELWYYTGAAIKQAIISF